MYYGSFDYFTASKYCTRSVDKSNFGNDYKWFLIDILINVKVDWLEMSRDKQDIRN